MKANRLTWITILLGVFIVFMGCKKNESESFAVESTDDTCIGMLRFNSDEEFAEAQQMVLNMSNDERHEWENQQGFKSYATKCEELFDQLDAKGIDSDEDIFAFVKENSIYFYLREEEGELYLTSYLEDSPYYEFVDENRMIQIGEKLIKVFDEGLITAPLDKEEALSNVQSFYEPAQEDFNYLDNTLYNYDFDKDDIDGCDCKPSEIIARKTNGNNRTYVRFYIDGLYDNYGFGLIDYWVKIRPYKKTLGIWYWCNRTITYNIYYIVADRADMIKFGTLRGTYEGSCYKSKFYSMGWYLYDAKFLQINGYAATPNAKCNLRCWVDY